MRLFGLTLETVYFEDYLSFLTEVLELELFVLTDVSMRLDLQGTYLEILKVPCAPYQVASNIEFNLDSTEFQDLKDKVSFFYYRNKSARFLLLGEKEGKYELVDPDGRVWRFRKSPSAVNILDMTPLL